MGKRGECSREEAKREILLYASNQKRHKRSEFIEDLVNKKKRFAKNTVYKYLDELVEDRLMTMEPGSREDSFKPEFLISKLGLETVRQIEINKIVDSLDTKWLELLRRFLIRIKTEGKDPKAFLNNNCITFIGDIPCAFSTSVEAMQSHVAFRESLHQRHTRDLERFREEFIRARLKGDVANQKKIESRIVEEVGWTVEDYFSKLMKKVQKQKGMRKIMTFYGITEEMLAEFHEKSMQQARTKERAWLRFLEKHYPDIQKPIKDRVLASRILKEFEQYWKKEYWEEGVGDRKES